MIAINPYRFPESSMKFSSFQIVKDKLSVLVDYIRAFVKDLGAFVLRVVTYPFSLSDKRPKVVKEKTPILFLHGFADRSSAWIFYRWYFARKGYSVHFLNFGSPFHSIEEYGARVKEKAEQIAKESGTDQLNIVGHSMGGLVASYYATDLAPAASVKKIVTLGTPLVGTKVASLGVALRLGKCTKQMLFQSPFVLDQNQKNEASKTQFYHFAGVGDLFIQPNDSALGLNRNATHVNFRGMGHISFLYSRRALKQVLKALKA
ncbi:MULTISPECIES: esterase/lipase family protein [Parachlamydia]|jgi:pimeloyl-ACP methyl ester carboxylesterase|uniref:esterase/lipase family protein n=1 Tax=Parachlamydia TaxID=83551 RepID=UPI00055A1FDE|nr:alpha/beta fold hydrolase [Parachlamydia acanthamoebae]